MSGETARTGRIERIGRRTLDTLELVGAIGLLLARIGRQVPSLFTARRGRGLAWSNLWFQLYRVGVKSIGVVALVTFCIGSILALQIGPILDRYGALDQLPALIGLAMFRELGPLIGAIVLTGFAGASIAAELGTMAVGEELKAMKAHAIDAERFLVLPRVVATTVMTVCLAVLSDWMGVLGGAFSSYLALGIEPETYLRQSFSIVRMPDVLTGLFKAGVFGAIIGGLACHLGAAVRGGAQGVGDATTRTVVLSIVALVCVDLLFTFIFYQLEL